MGFTFREIEMFYKRMHKIHLKVLFHHRSLTSYISASYGQNCIFSFKSKNYFYIWFGFVIFSRFEGTF